MEKNNIICNKMNIKNIKIIIFFIYLLFVYIFGANSDTVKYSEIILMLFLGLELIDIIRTKKIRYNVIIIIIFLFAFYCFLSNFWAINSELSIDKSKTLFTLAIFLLVTYNFFIKIDNGEEKLLKIIMWAGIIFAIYVVMYYGISEYFNKLMNGERVGAEINNVNSIGLQTSIAFIIALVLGLYDNKKVYLLLSIIPFVVALGTGSRKVIVGIIIGIMLMLILKREKKVNIIQLGKKILIIIIIISAFVYIAQLPVFSTIFERLEKMMNIVTGQGKVDNSTKVRMMFTKIGIQQFFKTPILGIGIGNSGYITLEAVGWSTYLHNNFVELLATTGIIGFTLYYSVYVYVIINCLKLFKKKNKYINIVLIIFLINLLLDYGVVSYYTKNTYVYILLGIIIVENVRKGIMNEQENKKIH